MAEIPQLTPTQQRIYDLLSDRRAHRRRELIALLENGANPKNLSVHLVKMRERLAPHGEIIICELGRGYSISYRMIYLEPSAR